MSERHEGSCHCGAIRFELEGDIDAALACDCSMCRRRGSLLRFIQPGHFTLRSDPDAVSTYTFNKHVIQHNFCARCGIHTHGEGQAEDGTKMIAVNVRCLPDVDLDALRVKDYQGSKL